MDVGLLSKRTLTQKRLALKLHLLPYLEQYKNVLYTNQIELSTFREYEIFRAEATPLTRNGEITIVKDFCKNYLVKHRLLAAEVLMDRDFLKRGQVKQTDKLANPAICAEDWETGQIRERPLAGQRQEAAKPQNPLLENLVLALDPLCQKHGDVTRGDQQAQVEADRDH